MKICEQLKPGDYVFVSYRSGRTLHQVESITPKGFIKVAGTLYTKDGYQRGGDTWSRSNIYPASDEEIEKFNKSKFVADVVRKLRNISSISYEQAVAINSILFEEKERQ